MADKRVDKDYEGTISHEFITTLNKVRKLMGRLHGNRSLYPAEFMMLGAIHHGKHCEENKAETNEPGVRVGELSKMVHSTKSATSKMLKALEEKGYVTRITDTKDRRVVYICLTDRGHEIIQESISQLRIFTDNTIQKMGEDDTRSLIEMLNKLYDAMVEVLGESDKTDDF
ncbi:MAG: MarR family transcriptional regulator [Anaerocolumna sp.]|jgi:DNA-binding MarR family transcriptional regulator|nr:MarR family transcriptional regulator [Anaerocolumna sp.]